MNQNNQVNSTWNGTNFLKVLIINENVVFSLQKKKRAYDFVVGFLTPSTAITSIFVSQELIFMGTQFSFIVRFIRKAEQRGSRPSDRRGL